MELQKTLVDMYLEKLNEAPRSAESIVDEAINDPQLFVFAELLRHPAVAGLNSTKVQLLRTISLGSWAELRSRSEDIPRRKIRKLTVLSLIRDRGWSQLPLHEIGQSIDIYDDDEVAALLVEMRKEGLILLRIDQRAGVVDIKDVRVHRDVDMSDLPRLREDLGQVVAHFRSVLDNRDLSLPMPFPDYLQTKMP